MELIDKDIKEGIRKFLGCQIKLNSTNKAHFVTD